MTTTKGEHTKSVHAMALVLTRDDSKLKKKPVKYELIRIPAASTDDTRAMSSSRDGVCT